MKRACIAIVIAVCLLSTATTAAEDTVLAVVNASTWTLRIYGVESDRGVPRVVNSPPSLFFLLEPGGREHFRFPGAPSAWSFRLIGQQQTVTIALQISNKFQDKQFVCELTDAWLKRFIISVTSP